MEGSYVDVCKVIVMQIMGWDKELVFAMAINQCGAADTNLAPAGKYTVYEWHM